MTLVELNTSLEIWKAPYRHQQLYKWKTPKLNLTVKRGMYFSKFYSLAIFKGTIIPAYVKKFSMPLARYFQLLTTFFQGIPPLTLGFIAFLNYNLSKFKICQIMFKKSQILSIFAQKSPSTNNPPHFWPKVQILSPLPLGLS